MHTEFLRRRFLHGLGIAIASVGSGACGDDDSSLDQPRGGSGPLHGGGSPSGGAGGVGAGDGGAGGADGSGDSTTWDARYDTALGAIPSTAKWVAPEGDDSNAGTEAEPYRTIAKALGSISGGGQIVLKDGDYEGPGNWINDELADIPSGLSNDQRTIIRAQHRFAVRLRQTTRPDGYYQAIVHLPAGASYIWVDGIVAETSWQANTADDNASATIWDDGTHNRVTRVIVKKSSCSQYGGSFTYGRYAVFEDCHSIGSGRYQFFGGTGGDSAPAGSAVLRRCTSYMPFGPSLEPTASFAFYGSNDGSYAECKDVLFANCYEIDSPHIHAASEDGLKWASFYHPKSVRNVRHIACGSLRSGAEYAAFRTDNYGPADAALAEYIDCFVWDFTNGSASGAVAFGKASNGQILVANCTAGALLGDAVNGEGTATQGNLFDDDTSYVTMRQGGNGAEQLHAVGAFLSEFGDAAFDVPQEDVALWPFPYESELSAVAAEILDKPPSDAPASASQSQNPYKDATFTRRIWEAAGSPMPDLKRVYGR